MVEDAFEVAADVHALIADLLPVLHPEARFEAELARVVLPVGRFAPSASTWTILERCARAPRDRWPDLVAGWLRDVADRAALAIADIELLGDVRELLRVRIVPKLAPADRAGLVVVPASDHFDAMIVIDHPEFGGPLTEARARLLGLRDLDRHVIPNTYERELAGVEARDQPLTAGESVRVITKPGCPYVSALFTELDRFLPERPPFGALFAMPAHATILLYLINSPAVREVLPVFTGTAGEMHATSEDPCTPLVFWRPPGRAMIPLDPRGTLPPELASLAPPPKKRRLRRRRG